MLGSYIPVVVMMVLSALLAIGMVVGSAVLGPRHPTKYKNSPYECGMTPVGSARERFPIKFYLIAMLFIIFDIETIFLYPWAVIYRDSGRANKLFLLGEMAVFVGILLVGYIYIIRKGALDWDEGQYETNAGLDKTIFKPRKPIRMGNESSGPVRLHAHDVPGGKELPSRQEEDSRAPAPVGGGR